MSLNCFSPTKQCVARNSEIASAGDDRPFPDADCVVFPVENMYDRIVIPSSTGWKMKDATEMQESGKFEIQGKLKENQVLSRTL